MSCRATSGWVQWGCQLQSSPVLTASASLCTTVWHTAPAWGETHRKWSIEADRGVQKFNTCAFCSTRLPEYTWANQPFAPEVFTATSLCKQKKFKPWHSSLITTNSSLKMQSSESCTIMQTREMRQRPSHVPKNREKSVKYNKRLLLLLSLVPSPSHLIIVPSQVPCFSHGTRVDVSE